MKPVLIVEGQRKNIVSMDFFSNTAMVDDGDSYSTYNLAESNNVELIWEGRYEPISEAIRKRIDAKEERQLEIAVRYIEESDLPFQEQNELKREYDDSVLTVEGLTEALGLIQEVKTGQTFNDRLEAFAESYAAPLENNTPSTNEEEMEDISWLGKTIDLTQKQ